MLGKTLVRFHDGSKVRFGFVEDNSVHALKGSYDTLGDLLSSGVVEMSEPPTSEKFSLSQVKLLSPVTAPAQIICQGANYSNHRQEAGMEPSKPSYNLIFTKSYTSLSGPTDNIVRPRHVELLDYEVEVGLVIKSPLTSPTEITQTNFLDYVAGIVIANDVSARDVQLVEGQWFKGKSYRTFCPTGPFLYLFGKDEASLIHDLDLNLSVNGEVRQSANTNQLLFKPEESLSELSEIVDLFPGDLVLTGTPGGVALKMDREDMVYVSNATLPSEDRMQRLLSTQKERQAYLKDGDEIRTEIKSSDGRINLGVQQNKVVSGAAK
ncbi:fumarylacetoacetate hydrolase family protein [Alicyclobacillus sp. SO9]|uniref:fumarylacetoacetate hydrolase family protein n=1 Tax=Alicyclobacillus sp. SO9 TaxID=2665646 RepID=UPI0018E87707|nr:fumarylacetoacetate hydrolase family protein [Alicyclobacillus sp. SO9]QQE77586.1 fumarylacetoacetate hydrolase family protein [Alicyclobacillus sp. SO9]